MGIIEQRLKIKGDLDSKDLDVMFDSGASMSVIRKDIAKKICGINYFDKPKTMILADGKTKIKAIGTCDFITEIDGCEIDDNMRVVDNLSKDMIIGASTLQKHKIKMIFDEKGDRLDLSECRTRIDYL